ncbi:hypothetical protein [Streptomyces chartreusis]|uniref:hypothetical protein n=1 Tax=Streptomyces chartreusis TaxID=1969 RepID=UPI0037FD5967
MEVKRDPLLWAALIAVLVVLASAEYRLAVACGFGQYVAAGVPAALDVYAIAALRARRDVLAVVAVLIGVNAASHLVEVGLLPVDVPLVVAVSAVAPLVLWRVHRLGEAPERTDALDVIQGMPEHAEAELPAEPVPCEAEPAEPITLERAEPVSTMVDTPADAVPVLGPWTPLAELAGGTSGTRGGTSPDQAFSRYQEKGWASVPTPGGTEAEPAPEPVPPTVPTTGTEAELGVADTLSEDAANTTFKARVAAVRHWLKTEPELTGTEIGTRLHVSDGYGRRLLRTAREDT